MVNGYSNQFWGWGGEDDNLYTRINATGIFLYIRLTKLKVLNQSYNMQSTVVSSCCHIRLYRLQHLAIYSIGGIVGWYKLDCQTNIPYHHEE